MTPSSPTSADSSPFPDWDGLVDLIGEPGRFFAAFLASLCRLEGVTTTALAVCPDASGGWKLAAVHPRDSTLRTLLPEALARLCDLPEGSAATVSAASPEPGGTVLVQSLPDHPGQPPARLLLHLRAAEDDATVAAARAVLPLIAQLPGHLELTQRLRQAEADLGQFASILDVVVLLHTVHRFQAAAMLLCNELATRHGCSRVSLGWLAGNQITVRAISHTDKIEARMEAIQGLAAAMEEAIDQGVEILWPSEADRFTVDRDHQRHATEQRLGQVFTLPLVHPDRDPSVPDRDDGFLPMAGAITLEREEGGFTPQQQRALRLLCDQVTPRLCQLEREDGWFGARLARSARKGAARLVGIEHTWAKLLGIGLAAALAILIFWHTEFRVRAPFTLETDSVTYLAAPFAGYLQAAPFQVGQEIAEGTAVFSLNTSELLLEKQAALAEISRHEAEAVRAEAAGEISGMRVSKARIDQARAQLDLVDHRLSQAAVKAGFDAVLVEGDLSEKLNAPVEQGEVLAKLARISGLYPEVKVVEGDIRHLGEGARGQLTFATRPDLSFAFEVERIEPAARPESAGNAFTVRCRFGEESADWWRPGMTGVARIDCGHRSLLWIFTRKSMDRLRLFFFR